MKDSLFKNLQKEASSKEVLMGILVHLMFWIKPTIIIEDDYEMCSKKIFGKIYIYYFKKHG